MEKKFLGPDLYLVEKKEKRAVKPKIEEVGWNVGLMVDMETKWLEQVLGYPLTDKEKLSYQQLVKGKNLESATQDEAGEMNNHSKIKIASKEFLEEIDLDASWSRRVGRLAGKVKNVFRKKSTLDAVTLFDETKKVYLSVSSEAYQAFFEQRELLKFKEESLRAEVKETPETKKRAELQMKLNDLNNKVLMFNGLKLDKDNEAEEMQIVLEAINDHQDSRLKETAVDLLEASEKDLFGLQNTAALWKKVGALKPEELKLLKLSPADATPEQTAKLHSMMAIHFQEIGNVSALIDKYREEYEVVKKALLDFDEKKLAEAQQKQQQGKSKAEQKAAFESGRGWREAIIQDYHDKFKEKLFDPRAAYWLRDTFDNLLASRVALDEDKKGGIDEARYRTLAKEAYKQLSKLTKEEYRWEMTTGAYRAKEEKRLLSAEKKSDLLDAKQSKYRDEYFKVLADLEKANSLQEIQRLEKALAKNKWQPDYQEAKLLKPSRKDALSNKKIVQLEEKVKTVIEPFTDEDIASMSPKSVYRYVKDFYDIDLANLKAADLEIIERLKEPGDTLKKLAREYQSRLKGKSKETQLQAEFEEKYGDLSTDELAEVVLAAYKDIDLRKLDKVDQKKLNVAYKNPLFKRLYSLYEKKEYEALSKSSPVSKETVDLSQAEIQSWFEKSLDKYAGDFKSDFLDQNLQYRLYSDFLSVFDDLRTQKQKQIAKENNPELSGKKLVAKSSLIKLNKADYDALLQRALEASLPEKAFKKKMMKAGKEDVAFHKPEEQAVKKGAKRMELNEVRQAEYFELMDGIKKEAGLIYQRLKLNQKNEKLLQEKYLIAGVGFDYDSFFESPEFDSLVSQQKKNDLGNWKEIKSSLAYYKKLLKKLQANKWQPGPQDVVNLMDKRQAKAAPALKSESAEAKIAIAKTRAPFIERTKGVVDRISKNKFFTTMSADELASYIKKNYDGLDIKNLVSQTMSSAELIKQRKKLDDLYNLNLDFRALYTLYEKKEAQEYEEEPYEEARKIKPPATPNSEALEVQPEDIQDVSAVRDYYRAPDMPSVEIKSDLIEDYDFEAMSLPSFEKFFLENFGLNFRQLTDEDEKHIEKIEATYPKIGRINELYAKKIAQEEKEHSRWSAEKLAQHLNNEYAISQKDLDNLKNNLVQQLYKNDEKFQKIYDVYYKKKHPFKSFFGSKPF